MTVGAITLEVIQVLGTRIVTAVDVKSTESATNVTREELERLPVERDLLVRGAARAGPEQGRHDCARRQLRRLLRRLVGRREHHLHQRPQRHGLLQPHRLLLRAVRVLQGIPGQDRRLLGGVRPHHRRRHQCRDALGHQRVRVRHRGRRGSRIRCRAQARTTSTATARRIIGSYDEYDRTTATVYASGPIIKDKLFFFALYEFRDYKPRQHRRRRQHASTAQDGRRLLGREDRLADQRQAPARAARLLRRERSGRRQLRLRLRDRRRAATSRTREFDDNGGKNWAATYTGYLTDTSVREGAVRRERARVLDASARTTSTATASATAPRRRAAIVGCTADANIIARTDTREAARLDFEWALGEHLLRFGLDHETNTSRPQPVLSRARTGCCTRSIDAEPARRSRTAAPCRPA